VRGSPVSSQFVYFAYWPLSGGRTLTFGPVSLLNKVSDPAIRRSQTLLSGQSTGRVLPSSLWPAWSIALRQICQALS